MKSKILVATSRRWIFVMSDPLLRKYTQNLSADPGSERKMTMSDEWSHTRNHLYNWEALRIWKFERHVMRHLLKNWSSRHVHCCRQNFNYLGSQWRFLPSLSYGSFIVTLDTATFFHLLHDYQYSSKRSQRCLTDLTCFFSFAFMDVIWNISFVFPYNADSSLIHHSSWSVFHLPHVFYRFFFIRLFLWLMNATMRRDDGSYDTARHSIVKRIWFEYVRASGDDHDVQIRNICSPDHELLMLYDWSNVDLHDRLLIPTWVK